MVQPLWKAVWRFLRKLKIDLPYDPAIALLGIYPRDTGVLMHRGTCTPTFIAALSTIAKLRKEPKCPSTDEWIKKLWFIYTMENYVAMRKNEIWPFVATWMELEGIMLSEISQRKTHVFTHRWILRNLTEDHKGLLNTENKLRVDGGGRARRVGDGH